MERRTKKKKRNCERADFQKRKLAENKSICHRCGTKHTTGGASCAGYPHFFPKAKPENNRVNIIIVILFLMGLFIWKKKRGCFILK